MNMSYEYVEEDIFNKSRLLLELNPVHKNQLLSHSHSSWNPLLPHFPYQRALARFWAVSVEHELLKAAWVELLFTNGDEQENAMKEVTEALEMIEVDIKGKKFFAGDNIGYLDLALGWFSYWLPIWEEVGSIKILDALKYPATTTWLTNFLNHPFIEDSWPPRDKMLVYTHDLN